MIAILKQAEGGSPIPELCREHGISNATIYKWRSKFGGMDASLRVRMTELGGRKPATEEDVCRRALEGRDRRGGPDKKMVAASQVGDSAMRTGSAYPPI